MIPNPFNKPSGNSHTFSLTDNDFRLIMDQIREPSLLIHLGKRTIIAANLQFTEFTGTGTNEIMNSDIGSIIVNCDYENISDGAINQWTISRKNQNPVMVTGLTRYISHAEKLALLVILGEKELAHDQPELNIRIFGDLVKVLDKILKITFSGLIEELINICANTFSAKHAIFYLQDKKKEAVKKVNTSGDTIFPESIPAIEIKRFKNIDYWEPGKRVLSEIQRVGRLNDLRAIVTLPISINVDQVGLLVMVFDDQKIRQKYEKSIQIFAEWIDVLIKIQRNLETFIEKDKSISAEIDQYSQFYENASDCAVILNDENKILDFNNNTSEFLKYSPIELLNQKASVIFENSEIPKILTEDISDSQVYREKPTTIYDREGTIIPVYYKIIPVEIMNVKRNLLIMHDASTQVETEKKIKQYENKAALGEVVADFAHEVRNPIHSLDSGLQLLRKKIGEADPNWKTVDQMHEDCLRMNDLMESVLSYSRQKIENFKEVNVELLLRRIVNRSITKYKAAGVDVIVKCNSENRIIFGDQRSMEQAFVNLLTNAFDAVKQNGGVISIQIDSHEADHAYLEVSISDTGPGIPPEIQDKLFEPFVSDKPKGTGLGLAITKRMIEAHQGRIELETYPGGTIFKVILPFQEIQGEQA